jgi:hypothetical protein
MTFALKMAFSLLIFSLLSCGESDNKSDAVARVFDQYLSRKDVVKQIPFGTSSRDSAMLAQEIIDQWVRRQLIFKRAENNLTDEQKDVSKQIEDYRISLLTYAYERELVRQKLDTVVSDAEIETYYKSNPGNFELKNNIIRLKYIKLPVSSPNGDKASKWFRSAASADRNRLEQYCKMYAVNYLLDDANWLLFDDVLKELPIQAYSMERFNRGERNLDTKDNEYRYLISITGFLIEETSAPLSFEKNNIRNIILNKRKIKLVEQMQKDVYNQAMNDKDVEIYTPAP